MAESLVVGLSESSRSMTREELIAFGIVGCSFADCFSSIAVLIEVRGSS